MILSTVWHSGTQYCFNIILNRKAELIHLCHDVLKHSDIVTTYRDPYLVGASWVNRYENREQMLYEQEENKHQWFTQWDCYRELLEREPVVYRVSKFTGPKMKSRGDPQGAHRMLEEDIKSYYQRIPRDWIEHAVNCSKTI